MANRKTMKKPRRQALLVLGMHRSGTSAIGGLLALLGACVPKSLMVPTKDNPRGYFESVEVMKANECVLSSAGSRWNDWGQFNPVWIDSLVAEQLRNSLADVVKKEYGTAPLLLIKDPRISRFLPLWLEVLRDQGVAPKIIIPVRHPLAVARSLEVRDHFGRNRSLLLWLRHVLDAESSSRNLPRSFVCYESMLADWKAAARRIATELKIVWPKWSDDTQLKISDFLSSELRHHSETAEAIPGDSEMIEWVRQTYEALMQACEHPLEQATLTNLDRIRHEFNLGSAIYAPVVREHEKRVEGLYADIKTKLAESDEKCRSQAEMLADAERKFSESGSTHGEQCREAEAFPGRLNAEGQSNVQQKMMEEQMAVNAAAFEQALGLAVKAHAASLAEQQERYETAVSEHSRQLAHKDAELAQLAERITELNAQRDIATTDHQSALQDLQDQLLRAEHIVAELSGDVSQLQSTIETQSMELHRALAAAESTSKVRFRETAKLTEMLFQSEAATQEQADRVAELSKELSLKGIPAHRDKRHIALLEFRIAVAQSTLDAWQRQAHTYALALNQVRSSLAWRILSRVNNLQLPPIQEPALEIGIDSQVEMLRASELFDASWYLERHPDAAESGMEPERHYLLIGAPAGDNPGPEFDSIAYLMEYPDVRQAAMDPLVHYLEYGQAESRKCIAPADTQE